MFKGLDKIFSKFKDNKKLMYAVNIFILLAIISFILKIDTSKTQAAGQEAKAPAQNQAASSDRYSDALEKRLEELILKIDGVKSVSVMIYTKNTPVLEPVYDENTSSESNIETGSDGVKKEVKRDTNQKQVKIGPNNQVVEKYYSYPEVSGVLIVVDYEGSKNIKNILMNSVKTLLNIGLNNIEIVLAD